MKKIIDKKTILTIIISGLFFSCVSGYAATIILSKDVVYDNKTSEAEAVNVQDAVDELYEIAKLGKCPVCEFNVGKTWTFDYTGGEQEFNVPCNGTYKLETWGAQGGSYDSTLRGGYGAYTVSEVSLLSSEKLYINVGSQGSCMNCSTTSTSSSTAGGYNGGGIANICTEYVSSDNISCSGGGATHIALESGLLKSFSSKMGTYDNTNKNYSNTTLFNVSSGGGGSTHFFNSAQYAYSIGGNGGGIVGGLYKVSSSDTVASHYGVVYSLPTQTSIGSVTLSTWKGDASFGEGAGHTSGGGGGLYGGGAWSYTQGGSSYIGNSKLTNKSMYCYDCQTSNDVNTKTISNTCVNATPTEKCSKTGNGYAKITLVSLK